MKEEVDSWMKQAEEEFDTAKINFKVKKYFSSAFWCQQSVEKSLKALLIHETGRFPKVHDLVMLAKLNKAPLRIMELCAKINPAYIASRYPDFIQTYSKEDCKQIIDACQEVLKWVKNQLN